MIFLYNIFILLILTLSLPIILIKSFINPRFRYKIKDRFLPSFKITNKKYMLFHASSFGEAKTLLSITDSFEKYLNKISVFSLFTDTGYKFIKNRRTFIMPIDFYPLYKRIFHSAPDLALFFETELWPSYITFLKNRDTKLVLINARMSDKSFRLYKLFSFLFKKIIGMFDVIIAKSEEDAEKFKVFNNNVVVCGNLKQIKQPQEVSENDKKTIMKEFLINTDKPVLTFGSMHKEEIDFVVKSTSKLKNAFFIIVAPRYEEDADEFHAALSKTGKTVKRTQNLPSSDILILDTMGELEDLYKISDVVFIGGSTKKILKGHNPVEPLIYKKFTVCGPYTESFRSEIDSLLEENMITIVYDVEKFIETALKYKDNPVHIDSDSYFKKHSKTLECYIGYLKKYEE